jgi:hypothetical protein
MAERRPPPIRDPGAAPPGAAHAAPVLRPSHAGAGCVLMASAQVYHVRVPWWLQCCCQPKHAMALQRNRRHAAAACSWTAGISCMQPGRALADHEPFQVVLRAGLQSSHDMEHGWSWQITMIVAPGCCAAAPPCASERLTVHADRYEAEGSAHAAAQLQLSGRTKLTAWH